MPGPLTDGVSTPPLPVSVDCQPRSTFDQLARAITEVQRDLAHLPELSSATLRHLAELELSLAAHDQVFTELLSQCRTDVVTELWNRRAFDEQLQLQVAICRRYFSPLSMVLLDVDGFKEINDRYGHLAGDQALLRIGQVLKRTLRDSDFVARFGGDEFAAILPQTSSAGALATAERLRRRVSEINFIHDGHQMTVSVSAGVAEFPAECEEQTFLKKVDTALYQAKSTGRNRVRLFASK